MVLGLVALLLFVLLLIKFLVLLPQSTLDPESKGQHFLQILILSIVIVAIAVPEGLPLAITFALASATIKMFKDNIHVRVLRACETMGTITSLCCDMTGLLMQNHMTVVAGTVGVCEAFGRKAPTIAETCRDSLCPHDVLINLGGVEVNQHIFVVGTR